MTKPHVSWLLPPLIRGSGGHRTILSHATDLARRGYPTTLYAADEPGLTEEDARKRINDWFVPFDGAVRIGWHTVSTCDVLFATYWMSAAHVAGSPFAARKAYFVQDFEAHFDPMGDGYLLAEATYQLGLSTITIGNWLTDLVTHTYGGDAAAFEFTADTDVYQDPSGGERVNARPTVVAIYQPEKPRRCPLLTANALAIVKERLPNAQIHVYGSLTEKPLWFEHVAHGLVTPEQCAELYRRADVGVCLSSTNPSRVPFEMMAAGCPVVDLDLPNNRHDYTAESITLAHPTPEAVAAEVIALLQDTPRRQRRAKNGLAMMASRPQASAFDRFEHLVTRLHQHGHVRDERGPREHEPRDAITHPLAALSRVGENEHELYATRLRKALDDERAKNAALQRDLAARQTTLTSVKASSKHLARLLQTRLKQRFSR